MKKKNSSVEKLKPLFEKIFAILEHQSDESENNAILAKQFLIDLSNKIMPD